MVKMATTTSSKILNNIFLAICIIATIFFTVYCISQYIENEDASVVTFAEYHKDKDAIYPAVTLCFSHYIRQNVLENNIALKNSYEAFCRAVNAIQSVSGDSTTSKEHTDQTNNDTNQTTEDNSKSHNKKRMKKDEPIVKFLCS